MFFNWIGKKIGVTTGEIYHYQTSMPKLTLFREDNGKKLHSINKLIK